MFARPIAAHLAHRLGQNMVIDNKSGAGGTLGTAIAARAPADGYTLLLGDTGLTYAPAVYPSAGFDFGRDFAAVSAFARTPYVLAVNRARLDVANLSAFIDAAKRSPIEIPFGSAGIGTVTHLALGLFEIRAGVTFNHIPYRGGAPMLQDLLSGQITAAFVLASAIAPHLGKSDLRALAVASRRREPLLPNVPSMPEAGLDNFRATIWFGLFAPKATPDPILDRLHDAVQDALATPDVRRLWAEQAARVEPESREAFQRFVDLEIIRWSRIARTARIVVE
jgi:tripartite-type tricarboxylate transporter receptor subunit TctC